MLIKFGMLLAAVATLLTWLATILGAYAVDDLRVQGSPLPMLVRVNGFLASVVTFATFALLAYIVARM